MYPLTPAIITSCYVNSKKLLQRLKTDQTYKNCRCCGICQMYI